MSKVSIIVACDACLGIGFKRGLPWKDPVDMATFKRETIGSSVVMGRHTYESLPAKYRPLPDRINYVLSQSFAPWGLAKDDDGSLWCSALTTILIHIEQSSYSNRNVYIIGGAMIYSLALNLGVVDRVIMTRMKDVYQCDTYFPALPTHNCSWKRQTVQRTKNWVRDIFTKVPANLP